MSSKSPETQTPIVNPACLEPLYAPWEEPNAHRVRGDKPGGPAKVIKNRRPSPITIVKAQEEERRDI